LDGLTLAEIEQQSDMNIADLPIPSFAVREITADPQFTGGVLSKLSKDEFKQWVKTW
jgi:CYTH domain-containing protein